MTLANWSFLWNTVNQKKYGPLAPSFRSTTKNTMRKMILHIWCSTAQNTVQFDPDTAQPELQKQIESLPSL